VVVVYYTQQVCNVVDSLQGVITITLEKKIILILRSTNFIIFTIKIYYFFLNKKRLAN
jgi:hypothetical protein